jgi:hypothetical protein
MVELSRQLLVLVFTVGVVLFYQYYDDKKNKTERDGIWSVIKCPILMASLVYLGMNLKSPKGVPQTQTQTQTQIIGGLAEFSPDNIYTELANF